MFRGWSFVPGKPKVSGYDTGALFRKDCLLHIQHLQMDLEADMKKVQQAEKEYAAGEEQLKRMNRLADESTPLTGRSLTNAKLFRKTGTLRICKPCYRRQLCLQEVGSESTPTQKRVWLDRLAHLN